MSTKITGLKGWRTRCRNSIETELQHAAEVQDRESYCEGSDILPFLDEIQKCTEMLKTHSGKLEAQSEKLIEALDDGDTEFIEEVLNSDWDMMCHVDSALINLKYLKEKIQKRLKKEKEKEHLPQSAGDENEILVLQHTMQEFMTNQMQQQQEFLQRQEMKEKSNCSVKLPKLDLATFSGNKLKWSEFWDTYECTIHKNEKLSNVEKFSYLQSKLTAEAKGAISGLALTNTNYNVAITILQERYGSQQEVVDLHYSKIIKLEEPANKTVSLRHFLDEIEKHLRSLEVLQQDVDQDVFVSMIKSKIPKEVLLQLEIQKGSTQKWTVTGLRKRLREYILARERTEHESKPEKTQGVASRNPMFQMRKPSINSVKPRFKYSNMPHKTGGSSEALTVHSKESQVKGYSDQCRYCTSKHWSDECPKYQTINARKGQLRNSCFRCLQVGHASNNCKKDKLCVYCGEKNLHHRSLCPKKFKVKLVHESANVSEEVSNTHDSATNSVNSNEEMLAGDSKSSCQEDSALISSEEMVLMQTAKTDVKNPNTSAASSVRVLLDCGSQRTYITEHLANKLGLRRGDDQEIKLVTFGSNKPKIIQTPTTKLGIQLKNGCFHEITANIMPNITGTIQRNPIAISSIENLKDLVHTLDMADSIPTEREYSTVELLLGNDYYLDIILPQKIELQPGLYLLGSKLGWLLTGRSNNVPRDKDELNMLILNYDNEVTETGVFSCTENALNQKPGLEDFWKIESIGITDDPNQYDDDDKALNHFKETVEFENGRYQVSWPWRNEDLELPVNRDLALGRLKSAVKRMQKHPEVMKNYDAVIQRQLQNGVIEKVEGHTNNNLTHYIPHHAVINPLKPTTKLRTVYDASARAKGNDVSLNDCLYRGPVMLKDLCGVLMRFRTHQIGIVADIEKAFLQVGLKPNERDVTRFFWLKDYEIPDVRSDNIQAYRFCRVPFGMVSSPFLLAATIETHLDRYKTETAEKLKNNLYVDNVITGTTTLGEAVKLYNDSKEIFNDASMNLREWISNSSELNNIIPEKDRTGAQKVTVLGHNWNVNTDTLSVKKSTRFDSASSFHSKRNVLKQVASIFDPLGLLSPVVLKGKLLLQKLWCKHLDWDSKLDDEDEKVWLSVRTTLLEVSKISIPRCIASSNRSDSTTFNLLCFCDASANAFAALVYLHQSTYKTTTANLVFSKTRLAPVKAVTIPRLELMAILIGVRCLNFVRDQIDLPLQGRYLWSDSRCALEWLTSKRSLPVFVKNRVNEIKKSSDIKFEYVKSEENPADVASRGATASQLNEDQLWWHGPKWLIKPETEWKSSVKDENSQSPLPSDELLCSIESDSEKKENDKETGLVTFKTVDCYAPFGLDCTEYSTATKLFRITAYVTRFIHKLRRRSNETGVLKNHELVEAEQMWVKYIQKKCFIDVFKGVSSEHPTNLLIQLGLYLDSGGLLRCRGRLEHANLSEAARYPLLLPKNERLTQMLIERSHKQILHSGVSQTLSQIRHKYWVPNGRATVRKVLRLCRVCRRHEGPPYRVPHMPAIPKIRVSESTPFEYTGVDYLGPLNIKTDSGPKKVWICLYTCLVTRAIHLELMNDMTTEEFLLGFRRFVSQRGSPIEIISDNAQNFKLASQTLSLIWSRLLKDDAVQTYVSNHEIKWKFIVEMAPWMGGYYERLVGVVKRSLRKTIGRTMLTNVQMQTIVKEIEAVVNSRPLVYVGDDINSNITLTPGHFLSLNPKTGIPSSDTGDSDPDFDPYESSAKRL